MRILLKVAAAAAALCAPGMADAAWREASTTRFVIYSEESAESLRKFALRLEKHDQAMRYIRGIPDQDPGKANRLTVFVVSNVGRVQKLANSDKEVGGFYIPRAEGSIAIVPRKVGGGAEWETDAEIILRHEYAHHLFFATYTAAVPSWLSEGFAEFHSTAEYKPDGGVGVGLPARHRAGGLLLGKAMHARDLVTYGTGKLKPEQREALYSRGWLLTHYLTFTPERKGQMGKYITAINSGKSLQAAAVEAFGDLDKLDKDLEAYLRRDKMHYIPVAAAKLNPGEVTVRELSPGENAIMDLRIVSDRGVTEEQAKELVVKFRAAAAPYPNDVAVQTALAEAEYDARNYAAAEAAADRALAVDPKALGALTYRAMAGMALMDEKDEPTDDDWKEVRRRIVAANRADPEAPHPLILFYDLYGRQGVKPTPAAVAGLRKAYDLAPQDRGLRVKLGRQMLIDGNGAEAKALLAPVAYDPHSGAMGRHMAAVLAAIESGGAEAGLKAFHRAPDEKQEEGAGGSD